MSRDLGPSKSNDNDEDFCFHVGRYLSMTLIFVFLHMNHAYSHREPSDIGPGIGNGSLNQNGEFKNLL